MLGIDTHGGYLPKVYHGSPENGTNWKRKWTELWNHRVFLGWTFVKSWSLCNSFRQNLFFLMVQIYQFFPGRKISWVSLEVPMIHPRRRCKTWSLTNKISSASWTCIDVRRYILGVGGWHHVDHQLIIKERHWCFTKTNCGWLWLVVFFVGHMMLPLVPVEFLWYFPIVLLVFCLFLFFFMYIVGVIDFKGP